MPVETVDIMQCEHVDKGLHLIYRKEMTGYIQMHTAIAETGFIIDFNSRKFNIGSLSYVNRLSQSLNTIKYTGFRRCCNRHPVCIYFQLVAFLVFTSQSQF